MQKPITFVGMDARKVGIKLAVLVPRAPKAVEWSVANEKAAVRRMVRKVQRLAEGGELCFCYEAGPCGYALQRWIEELGVKCVVVAPSLIPRKPGDRIKTDRRDARKLAELLRAGLLTEVHPPTVEDEAVRDLCRAREDAHQDLVRCRHRASKMLLRRGWIWNGTKKAWGQGHRLWLRSLRFEQQADQVVFDNYLQAIAQVEEFSSADSERRGAITKAGNRHARRLLVEAAWHYRHQPNPQGLRRHRQGQPAEIIAIADRAMFRLNRRFNRMLAKGKPAGKTVVAVARELTGFIWAALHCTAA